MPSVKDKFVDAGQYTVQGVKVAAAAGVKNVEKGTAEVSDLYKNKAQPKIQAAAEVTTSRFAQFKCNLKEAARNVSKGLRDVPNTVEKGLGMGSEKRASEKSCEEHGTTGGGGPGDVPGAVPANARLVGGSAGAVLY